MTLNIPHHRRSNTDGDLLFCPCPSKTVQFKSGNKCQLQRSTNARSIFLQLCDVSIRKENHVCTFVAQMYSRLSAQKGIYQARDSLSYRKPNDLRRHQKRAEAACASAVRRLWNWRQIFREVKQFLSVLQLRLFRWGCLAWQKLFYAWLSSITGNLTDQITEPDLWRIMNLRSPCNQKISSFSFSRQTNCWCWNLVGLHLSSWNVFDNASRAYQQNQ